MVCHAQCRVQTLSLCFLHFCLVEHNHLSCFYEKLKSFGSFGFSLSCLSFAWAALIIEFFRTSPLVWGVILVNVIFKNVIGSKWDCKWYISALWKDYQRWSSLSQTHTLRIDRSCFHARMQSDLFIQIKLSFWVTS